MCPDADLPGTILDVRYVRQDHNYAYPGTVADTRECAQCGVIFTPRREHARFCSARCRAAWNREHVPAPAAGEGALDWSVTAMLDTTDRLLRAHGWDQADAFAVITEAVWWITMVDATMFRYHPDTYAACLRSWDGQRLVVERTFGGLRFVRNRMGYEEDHEHFIRPTRSSRVAGWTWKPVPEPAMASLSPRGQDWELARYRAYQAQLADRTIAETLERAAAFLSLAAENSLSSR